MKNLKIYLMLVCVALFNGATFGIAKYSVNYFSTTSAAAWRFGIASIVMFMVLIVSEGIQKENLRKNGLPYLIIGIIGVFGFNALFFLGLKYTSPINGALIMGTNPILTIISARIILKESIKKRQIVGVIFALLGVVLVITQGSLETIKTLSLSIGDAFILLGSLCWALYGVLGRKLVRNSTTLATTTYTMIIGTFCLIILSMFFSNPVPLTEIKMNGWGAIIFMSIFTSTLGYLWWNKGIKEIGAGKTSLFFNFVPVFTIIIAFVTGEQITSVQLVGTALVVIGVVIASGVMDLITVRQKEKLVRSV